MFTVKDGIITNKTDVNLAVAKQLFFKFDDTEFADSDKFELIANGVENKLYGFSENGCLKFVNVNFGELKSGKNTVNFIITQNGTQILSESIIINVDADKGGNAQPYQLPLKTEKIQLFSGKENGQYYLSTTKYSKFQDNYTLQSGETGEHEFIYNLDINYQISPFDDLQVIFTLWNDKSFVYVYAELYIDDVLIRKGNNSRTFMNDLMGAYNYKILHLSENYCNDLITNTIGKELKLKLFIENARKESINYRLWGGKWQVQPTADKGSESGSISLIKNYNIIGIDDVYNLKYVCINTKNKTLAEVQNNYSAKTVYQKYSEDELSLYLPEYEPKFYLPKNYKEDNITPPNVLSTLNVYIQYGMENEYKQIPTTIIFRTADTFTFNLQLTTRDDFTQDGDWITIYDQDKLDFLVNKPLDFQPNKKYMMTISGNYIYWCELQNLF